MAKVVGATIPWETVGLTIDPVRPPAQALGEIAVGLDLQVWEWNRTWFCRGGEMVWGVGSASVCIACCCELLGLAAHMCAVFSGVVEVVPVVVGWLFGIVAFVPELS